MSQQEKRIAAFSRALAGVIRKRREELGLSLTQLGTQAGLSQQSISYLERLKRLPNIDTLVRVSDALNISLSELIKRAEIESPVSSPVQVIDSKRHLPLVVQLDEHESLDEMVKRVNESLERQSKDPTKEFQAIKKKINSDLIKNIRQKNN